MRIRLIVPVFAIYFAAVVLLPPAFAFDLSNATIPRDAIQSGGPPKDGIPALTDPIFIPGDTASYLRDHDRVLGVFINGQAKAYPIRIMNWHEIINDKLGGEAITVTYCPLCGTGMVFEAQDKGRRAYFGVSGLLYNSDVLLYDKATDSLWSQIKKEAIAGPLVGEQLNWLPVKHTTWAQWMKEYPKTEVVSLQTGYFRDYSRDPYHDYEQSERIMFSVVNKDSRLSTKTWVLGVEINGTTKAYPLNRLHDNEILEDKIDGKTIKIHYDAKARSAWLTDKSGKELPSVQIYWFAWSAFHPQTELYE